MKYSEPVNQLFSLDCPEESSLIDYRSIGITFNHVNELMQLGTDDSLLNSEETDFWATVHAWRALAQMQVAEVIPCILDMRDKYDFDLLFDSELPEIFRLIGLPAIEITEKYIVNSSKSNIDRFCAIECIGKLGEHYYKECVIVLSNFLKNCHDQSTKDLAGMTVSSLLKLKAVEKIDVIREAFERKCVGLSIAGDIEDVEIGFGIRMQRSTPRPRYHDDIFGIASIINDIPKAGRNDPCPCGSGKKFKKCCLH